MWRTSAGAKGNLMLCSLTEARRGTRWEPRKPLEARCPSGEHDAPRGECSCGIYSHKSWASALDQAQYVAGAVIGEVRLWGRVIEHEHGYRAQFARPTALWLPVGYASQSFGTQEVVDLLRRRSALAVYGVPVGVYDERTGLAVDTGELRRIFVREPRPPIPLPTLLWRIAWRGVRLALITATVGVTAIAGAVSGIGVFVVGVLLPLAAGTAVFRWIGPSLLGITLGVASTAGIAVAYARLGYRFDLIERTR